MSANQICGVYRLTEEKVFTYAGYECAAWWQEIKVPAGDYPVYARYLGKHLEEFIVNLPGTIVRDHFQSLYGGMSIGKTYDVFQNAGNSASYMLRARSYNAFEGMHRDGAASAWKIDVTKLENVHLCTECGTYTEGLRPICVTCAIAAENVRVAEINRRFPTLIQAVKRGGYAVSKFSSIIDLSIEHYLEERRTGSGSDGYYSKSICNTVKNVRALRSLLRMGKCEHDKSHAEHCYYCQRRGFQPVNA
jgi:hypothetical protein